MADAPLTREQIAELVVRYPLPEGVIDAVLNREELAEALGTSLNTVTSWLNMGMPALEWGRNGKPYELQLSACYAWNEASRRGEEKKKKRKRKRREKE